MDMWFWIFMTCCNLIIPLLMIGVGYAFIKNPPKERGSLRGYRTTRSRKSQEAWDFAQQHFAHLWIRLGWILLPVTVIAMLFLQGRSTDAVGLWGGAICLLQCVILIFAIFPTEKALKDKFDENGKPYDFL